MEPPLNGQQRDHNTGSIAVGLVLDGESQGYDRIICDVSIFGFNVGSTVIPISEVNTGSIDCFPHLGSLRIDTKNMVVDYQIPT